MLFDEQVINLLLEIGVEKIDTVTVMADPNNADSNRGFAFLELETDRDAQITYKKLQKKDAFGKGRNIKVAWAEPLNDPDEEEMQKVPPRFLSSLSLVLALIIASHKLQCIRIFDLLIRLNVHYSMCSGP